MSQKITDAHDVTDSTGKEMSSILKNNCKIKKLEFPSVTHPRYKSWRYTPGNFETVAKHIGLNEGQVRVYSSKQSKNSSYWNVQKKNRRDDTTSPTEFFMLKDKVANSLKSFIDVLVHESTHMIQDYKRLKMSIVDAEMDAHFAQALYLVRANETAKDNSLQLPPFIEAAKAYDADADYLTSRAFKKQKRFMCSRIVDQYKKAGVDITKRTRMDGLH